jgi:alpha/beta superfamily hydrolase
MGRRIESLFLAGPAGRLEALLEEPEEGAPLANGPRAAALICHPHPQHGGTMHNKVVYRMARGLRRAGHVALRFNYRGVNLSEGEYAHGEGELDDARVALEFLRERYSDLPFTLAGFSFGSRIALRLGCEIQTSSPARRVIAVGFPTVCPDRSFLERCTVPRVFVQSTRDEFGPVDELERIAAALPEPKRVVLIDARDHFFAGALDALEETIAGLEES